MASIPSYFLGIACLLLPTLASAQPGATPPGSVPPSSPAPAPYPAPAPAPAPAPYPAPAPAPDYGPNYGPNYGPPQQPALPQPNPPRGRSGWNVGVAGLVGSMTSSVSEFTCNGCEVTPPAVSGELHIGMMITPKLALQGEAWLTSRDLDDSGDSSVNQTMYLLTAQYWLGERIWIKGGIGVSSLSITYFDGFGEVDEHLESGTGLMAAIGYEIIQSGKFAVDLQLKTGRGLYSDESDEEVTTNLGGIGLHWY